MAVPAITFDVGNTLIKAHPSLGHIYADASARQGITIAPAVAQERFIRAWRDTSETWDGLVYGRSHGDARRFWSVIVGRVFDGACSARQKAAVLDDLYERFSDPQCWRVDSHWPAVRQTCRSLGLAVALISNWDLRLRTLLGRLGLLHHVDIAVISAESQIEKPDPRIFDHALDAMDAAPERSFHVGDTWKDDVVGAAGVGMHPVWLNPEGHPVPSSARQLPRYSAIRSLAELPDVLARV